MRGDLAPALPEADRGSTTSSVLLGDGRVLVAGHDGTLNMQPYDRSRYELEIFSPLYLHRSDGSLALHPVIAAARAAIGDRSQFEVSVDGTLRDACPNPTERSHAPDQHRAAVCGRSAHPRRDGRHDVATAPPTGAVAPPGWHLPFVGHTPFAHPLDARLNRQTRASTDGRLGTRQRRGDLPL